MAALAHGYAFDVRTAWDRRGAEGSPRRSSTRTAVDPRPRHAHGETPSAGGSVGILQPMSTDAGADEPSPVLRDASGRAGGDLDDLLLRSGRGDEAAFAAVYDAISPAVFGLAKRVVRDPAQAEEVTQEVFLDVWRNAARFDPSRGAARSWVLTIAHRRAVDRVRSAQSSTDRELRAAQGSGTRDYDEVVEAVESRLEAQAVRRCLQTLSELQREAVDLAYYSGHTYAQVATALSVPLGTIKTRLRDGLIRLRDCMGVTA
jgi:RNA polymerase sigma-70 factor (ECF subfamily)